jgi:2-oxo-4-hydroxy-4-carboxy--5-ureidoimidazoline (OHCU) decarboxylase
MSDAFQTAHWTGERTYDISAEVSPVSIRDQMIRGRLFAERAVAEQLIAQHPDEGLVVVGAGAAGMSRTQIDSVHQLSRVNMPLELGLFLGAKRLGGRKQTEKRQTHLRH